jgi:hypothetical protein
VKNNLSSITDKAINLSDRFKVTITLCFILSLTIQVFLSSYTDMRPTEALSYDLNDGWCNYETEGIGSHCFGDFYAPIKALESGSPYESVVSNYPPFSFILMEPFYFLNKLVPGRSALFIYLFVSILCLIFPLLHLIRRKLVKSSDIPMIAMVFLLAGPAISLIDRGNILAFTFPLIHLFLFNLRNCNYTKASKYALLFTLIKPQLILLALLLIFKGEIREFLKIVFGFIITSAVTIALFPRPIIEDLKSWVVGTIAYNNYSAIGVLKPINMSLRSTTEVFLNIFNTQISRSFLTPLISIFGIFVLYRFCRNLNSNNLMYNASLIVIFIVLFGGTSFHYYLALLLVPFCLLIVTESSDATIKSERTTRLGRNRESIVLSSIYIVAFVPLTLPWSITGRFDGRGWENVSAHWIIVQFLISGFGLFLLLAKNSKYKGRKKSPSAPNNIN